MTASPLFNITPHDLEVEQAVLGTLMFDNKAFSRIEGLLLPGHFYEPLHQRVYGAIQSAIMHGRLSDPLTLTALFENDMAFHDLGGIRYFADLVDRAPPSPNIGDYAAVLVDLETRRQLIAAGDAVRAEAMRGAEKPARILTQAEARLHDIARGVGTEDHWHDACRLGDMGRQAANGEGEAAFVETGIASYDATVGGLVKGRVNIFAGRPGMGKSAVAACIGLSMARLGQAVGMFSLEMDGRELAGRLACAAAFRPDADDNPEYFKANRRALTDEARRRMIDGASELDRLPLYYDDRPGLTPGQIAPAAKRLIRKWEKARVTPGAIIIDHLTIVRPDDRTGNMVMDVGAISAALRDLARETDVALVVLCQLSREVESRKVSDKRPGISDLRWSGEIEQDAAQITFIYRPDYYLKEPENKNYSSDEWLSYADEKSRWEHRVLLLNRKNRSGPSMHDTLHGLKLGCNAMWEV